MKHVLDVLLEMGLEVQRVRNSLYASISSVTSPPLSGNVLSPSLHPQPIPSSEASAPQSVTPPFNSEPS